MFTVRQHCWPRAGSNSSIVSRGAVSQGVEPSSRGRRIPEHGFTHRSLGTLASAGSGKRQAGDPRALPYLLP
jgi:hypothetical protein